MKLLTPLTNLIGMNPNWARVFSPLQASRGLTGPFECFVPYSSCQYGRLSCTLFICPVSGSIINLGASTSGFCFLPRFSHATTFGDCNCCRPERPTDSGAGCSSGFSVETYGLRLIRKIIYEVIVEFFSFLIHAFWILKAAYLFFKLNFFNGENFFN